MTRLNKQIAWTAKSIGLALSVFATSVTVAHSSGNSSSHMKTLGRTSQPIGHYDYCKKYTKDCSIRSRANSGVKLTRKRWNEMVAVNTHSNNSVAPVTDLEYYNREEYWVYPKKYGDCEDYVLLKRKLLIENGWPASSLLITVVTLPNGDGHAVLTVRTDRADYALDNLNNKILQWNKTEYRFLKRQSSRHSGKWETIADPRSSIVGAIKR